MHFTIKSKLKIVPFTRYIRIISHSLNKGAVYMTTFLESTPIGGNKKGELSRLKYGTTHPFL